MKKEELDKQFKDADSKLRVVFVCAMWLTGFDVKTLSCLYIDKPMKAHTLMQTIARANRVAEGKANGLIIDYIGIVKALRQALADYTANPEGGAEGNDPTIDKRELRKTDTYTDFEVFIRPTTDFMAHLMSRGGWLQVISPRSLAKEILKWHQEAIERYENGLQR